MSLMSRMRAQGVVSTATVAPSEITSFSGAYRFLSNFYPSKVVYGDAEYNTVEHAFVAAKSLDEKVRARVRSIITPSDAKHYGRRIALRPDWEAIKIPVMLDLQRQKYFVEPLRQWLLDTDEAELIEGNTWGDRFWGRYLGEGENHLGKLQMQVRAELRSV